MCKCGCNTCETKSTALVLNESKAPASILSEGLKHHMDTNKPGGKMAKSRLGTNPKSRGQIII